MDFKISGRNVEVTDAIRDYAQKKTAKLPRYYDLVQEIAVVLEREDHRLYHVELIVDIEHADPIVANSSAEDLYAAIDDTTDKAERQLTDHKEKVRNRKRSVTNQ
jgi:putative sigma-54 modulation protein